jgi:predicted TIM-barrel fold metal-dependent hydrolase
MSTSSDESDFRGSFVRNTNEVAQWHARGAPSPALEPALAIVDPHHHLFGASTDALHYRIEDLREDVSGGHRVIGTVYCEAYESGWRTMGPEAMRPVGEIERIVALTQHPLETRQGHCRVAAGIIGYADLTLGDEVARVLEAELEAAQGRLRGVRQRTATVGGAVGRTIKDPPRPHLMRESAYRRGVARLERHGLSFDAWLYHTQLDELIELADACPNTTIVLDHLGAPIGVAEYRARRDEVLAHWRSALHALAARPNVRVKVGGMGMTVFGFGFERADRPPNADELARAWQPFIETCVGAFGTQRCMFESNFPVDKQSCSYVDVWNAFKLATQGWSGDERRDLFYRTACRTYRLTELEDVADGETQS